MTATEQHSIASFTLEPNFCNLVLLFAVNFFSIFRYSTFLVSTNKQTSWFEFAFLSDYHSLYFDVKTDITYPNK